MDYVAKFSNLSERIRETSEEVELLVSSLPDTIKEAGTLANMCALYDAIRNLDDQIEEVGKAMSKALQLLSVTILPQRFQEEGVSTLTMKELGARFTVNTRITASMTDKERAMEWLREEGHGDIIVPTVNSSTLSKFASEYVLEQGQDLPAELFKLSTIQHMSRTKV
jgi:hypothetical protein